VEAACNKRAVRLELSGQLRAALALRQEHTMAQIQMGALVWKVPARAITRRGHQIEQIKKVKAASPSTARWLTGFSRLRAVPARLQFSARVISDRRKSCSENNARHGRARLVRLQRFVGSLAQAHIPVQEALLALRQRSQKRALRTPTRTTCPRRRARS